MRQAFFLAVLFSMASCAGNREVVPVQNVERTVSVWADDAAYGRHHLCTEYVTPAERLNTNKGTLGIPIGDKGVNVSYEHAESLATIYTVTEIMQFGQMALFRLCEAAGNGMIKENQYATTFNDTVNGVGQLLEAQLKRDQFAVQTHLLRLADKMVDLDRRRCDAASDPSVSRTERLDELNAERKQVRQEFVELRQSVDATSLVKEPKEAKPPSAAEAEAFETAARLYLEVKHPPRASDDSKTGAKPRTTQNDSSLQAKCEAARGAYEPVRACAELDSTTSTRAASLKKQLDEDGCRP